MTEQPKPQRRNDDNSQRSNFISIPGEKRLPPQNLELEQAVLGALMLERDALPTVVDILRPEVFYKPAHQQIFASILELFQNANPVDILTVTEELRRREELAQAGGPAYISELSARVASAANVEYHAHILVQKYIQRELINVCSGLQRKAQEDSTDVFELLDEAEQSLYSLSGDNLRREALNMEDLTLATFKKLQELAEKENSLTGIPSGFAQLDELTSGWQPGDLVILGARPSMGKTAFMLNTARNAAVDAGKPVMVFSLEMGAEQLAMRMIGCEASIESGRMRTGKLQDYEYQRLRSQVDALSKAPIYIDDTPALSVYDMRAKCRRFKAEKGIELIIIDYLTLMRGPSSKNSNREQEVAAISRSLKQLAKELEVPVIALSQLNRSVETRNKDEKRPQLSDLRETGAIEQDADVVMFLYRPEYYGLEIDEDGNSTDGIAEVIVAKQRNGPVDTVRLNFQKEFGRFSDLEDNFGSGGFSSFAPGGAPLGGGAPGGSFTLPSKMNDDEDESEMPSGNTPF